MDFLHWRLKKGSQSAALLDKLIQLCDELDRAQLSICIQNTKNKNKPPPLAI